MPMKNNNKAEQSRPLADKLGAIDYKGGVEMLKAATRKKYRVATNANAWIKRGCYYIVSDNKK